MRSALQNFAVGARCHWEFCRVWALDSDASPEDMEGLPAVLYTQLPVAVAWYTSLLLSAPPSSAAVRTLGFIIVNVWLWSEEGCIVALCAWR